MYIYHYNQIPFPSHVSTRLAYFFPLVASLLKLPSLLRFIMLFQVIRSCSGRFVKCLVVSLGFLPRLQSSMSVDSRCLLQRRVSAHNPSPAALSYSLTFASSRVSLVGSSSELSRDRQRSEK